jgi:hypothetical protein
VTDTEHAGFSGIREWAGQDAARQPVQGAAMNKGFFGSVLIVLAGAGLALGQAPTAPGLSSPPRASVPGTSGGTAEAAAGAGTAASGTAATKTTTEETLEIAIPWNPHVPHANVWPHDEPIDMGGQDCVPPGDFWLVPEYLFWAIKGPRVPALASTGTPASAGVLGRPGAALLPNSSDLNGDPFSGGRFTAGTWLNDEHTLGFQGSYFFLGEETERFEATSAGGPGSPVLARPFTDIRTGQPGALLVASPDLGPGAIRTSFGSSLQGAEGDLVYEAYCCQPFRVEVVGGFRYEDLAEELGIGDAEVVPRGPSVLGGHGLSVVDEFHTRNTFFGGELGARGEYQWGHWVGTLAANLALGSNKETVRIIGATNVAPRSRLPRAQTIRFPTVPTAPTVPTTPTRTPGLRALDGGLLALPSNEGRYRTDEFSAIPQLDLQLAYQFNPYVRAFVGYTFVYWSEVARPGNQIDLGVNPALVPALLRRGRRATGPERPAFVLQETDFWAQGLDVGLEFRY